MPVSVTKLHFTHQGGTKEYYLVVLQRYGQQSFNSPYGLGMRWWGKIGLISGHKIEFQKSASKLIDDVYSERIKKGYSLVNKSEELPLTVPDALSSIPSGLHKYFTHGQLHFIDPTSFDAGSTRPYLPDVQAKSQENFNAIMKAETDRLREIEDREEKQALQIIKQNPMFGIF